MKNLLSKLSLLTVVSVLLFTIYSCEQAVIDYQPEQVEISAEDLRSSMNIIYENVIYRGETYSYNEFMSDEVLAASIMDKAEYSASAMTSEDHATIERGQISNEDVEIKMDLHFFDKEEDVESFGQEFSGEIEERGCGNGYNFRIKKLVFASKPNFKGTKYVIYNLLVSGDATIDVPSYLGGANSIKAIVTSLNRNSNTVGMAYFNGGNYHSASGAINGNCKATVSIPYTGLEAVGVYITQL